ncbi:imidazoleglycerol-phosphate dehydratase HisB [Dehalobacterium formicoaceticum]|uniref:Imidazoleglycerol-phosphate dehydratase n=2 Tax=Dehalobacterium formicoaceticum TaxID=51515 RepID=A0ABT1Y7N3_9FIRM|nr:imidazoleglycerol-phosphate dehydratase HisB [Dehalobacterium formicoaceticum]MCR6546885.1 imidazoleglycerol-phosphate dehydratase HisB [Dehalobacterium formicoaceticum]
MRQGMVERNTAETQIKLMLQLEGEGKLTGSTGIGFFDHMMTLFCRHSLFDCTLEMTGDLDVDEHHSIEDLGLVLGQAFREALGDKAGINRYGTFFVPMDETLIMVSLDLSGRPYLVCDLAPLPDKVGNFDTELVPEFLRAFAFSGGITLHVRQISGSNSHHIIEGIFKALARALRQAAARDNLEKGIPSSKGIL